MKYFGWTVEVYEAFSKTFPGDYSDEALSFLHKCIKDEFCSLVKSKNKQSLEKLFFCLGDFHRHFCWKIVNWQKESPMKRSCVCVLSYLVQVGVMLSKGKSSTKWIDSILVAMKVFPGPLELLCDALILVRNVKEKFHPSFGAILNHFLFTSTPTASGAAHYFKVMLLLRRLKFISGNKLEKTKIVSLALSIPVPRDSQSWLLSHGMRDLADVHLKLFPKMFLSKKLPPEFFKKLRNAFEVEVQSKENFCLSESFIGNRDESAIRAPYVKDPTQIFADSSISACVGKKKRIKLADVNKQLPSDESVDKQLGSILEDNQSSVTRYQNTSIISPDKEPVVDSVVHSDGVDLFVIDTGMMDQGDSDMKESPSDKDSSQKCVDPSSVFVGKKRKKIKLTNADEQLSGDESFDKQLCSILDDNQSSVTRYQNTLIISPDKEPVVDSVLHNDGVDLFVIDTEMMDQDESLIKRSPSTKDDAKVFADSSNDDCKNNNDHFDEISKVSEINSESAKSEENNEFVEMELAVKNSNNDLNTTRFASLSCDTKLSSNDNKMQELSKQSDANLSIYSEWNDEYSKQSSSDRMEELLTNQTAKSDANQSVCNELNHKIAKQPSNEKAEELPKLSDTDQSACSDWNDENPKQSSNDRMEELFTNQSACNELNDKITKQPSNEKAEELPKLSDTDQSACSEWNYENRKQSSNEGTEELSKHSDTNQHANNKSNDENPSLAMKEQLHKGNDDANNAENEVSLSESLQETVTLPKVKEFDPVSALNDVSRTNESVTSPVKLTPSLNSTDNCNQNETKDELKVAYQRNEVDSPNILGNYIENVLNKIVDEVAYRISNEGGDLASKGIPCEFSEGMSKRFTAFGDQYPTFSDVSKKAPTDCIEHISLPPLCAKNSLLNYRDALNELDVNDAGASEFAELDGENESLSGDPSSSSDERDDDKPHSPENSFDGDVQFDSTPSTVIDSDPSGSLQTKRASKTFTLDEASDFVAKLPQLTVQVGQRCDEKDSTDNNELSTNHTETFRNKECMLKHIKVCSSPSNVEKNSIANDDNGIVVNSSNGKLEMEVDGIIISEYRIPDSDQILWKEPVVHLKKLRNSGSDGTLKMDCVENSTQMADDTIEKNELESQSIPVDNRADIIQGGNSLEDCAPTQSRVLSIDSSKYSASDTADKDSSGMQRENVPLKELPSVASPAKGRRALRPRKAAVVPDVSIAVTKRKRRNDSIDPALTSNLSQLTLSSPSSRSKLAQSSVTERKSARNTKVEDQTTECKKGYNLRSKSIIQPSKLKL